MFSFLPSEFLPLGEGVCVVGKEGADSKHISEKPRESWWEGLTPTPFRARKSPSGGAARQRRKGSGESYSRGLPGLPDQAAVMGHFGKRCGQWPGGLAR